MDSFIVNNEMQKSNHPVERKEFILKVCNYKFGSGFESVSDPDPNINLDIVTILESVMKPDLNVNSVQL
jgi:hypothetical protein